MKDKPLVSVFIPTYKSDITLIRAIDSVLAQNYDKVEILVVDDNEPTSEARKKTEELMLKYQGNLRLKYVKHPQNLNGSAARNTAFRNSSGKYITFLDDDDYYLEDKIKSQVEYMESNETLGGCYCWRRIGDKDICGKYNGDLSKQILSLEFTPCTPCLFIRRECYESLHGFDESYRRHQDFEFLLRYFEKGYELQYVPSVQVVISKNGINNTPKGQNLIDLKERFFAQFKGKLDEIKENDKKGWKKLRLNHYVPVFKDLIRYGYPWLAIKFYFKHCISLGFSFWRRFIKACFNGQVECFKRLLNKDGEK